MKRTLPVLYLATEGREWCQFLRAVHLVGRGQGRRAEAAKATDWQGTVVAADIALPLFKLRQAGQEERRVTRAGVSLMSERGGADWSGEPGRQRQKSAVAPHFLSEESRLSLSLSFFLRLHICSTRLGLQ